MFYVFSRIRLYYHKGVLLGLNLSYWGVQRYTLLSTNQLKPL